MALASKNELRPLHTQDPAPLPSGLVLFCCMSSTCDFFPLFTEDLEKRAGKVKGMTPVYPLLLIALGLNI